MGTPRFPLGQTVITRKAQDQLHPADISLALARHAAGDWGNLDEHDQNENEIALIHDLRLLSVYQDRTSVKFWIITEADRSTTTVLLPDDY